MPAWEIPARDRRGRDVRMWMVDPSEMCRQHLLGEHVECHMFRGSLLKGRGLRGFLESGLLDSRQLARRHDDLVAEMTRRGYRHASPLPEDFDALGAVSEVDPKAAARELASRCDACRALQSARTGNRSRVATANSTKRRTK
jgi:hypothetical protein